MKLETKNFLVWWLLNGFLPGILALSFPLLRSPGALLFIGAGYAASALFCFRGKVYRHGRWLGRKQCTAEGIFDAAIAVLWTMYIYDKFYRA